MERKRDVPILGIVLRQMMGELGQKRIESATVPFGIMPRQGYTPKKLEIHYPLKRDVKGRMINVPREAGVMCDGKQERFV